jgi:hypothetical protein
MNEPSESTRTNEFTEFTEFTEFDEPTESNLHNDKFNHLYISSEKMKTLILTKQWDTILSGLCFHENNNVYINSLYSKHFINNTTSSLILKYILNIIDNSLINNSQFIVHLNIKNLSFSDIEKISSFLIDNSNLFKERYPEQLLKLYVYNTSFVFSQLYKILSKILDKQTKEKIVVIK